MCVSLSLYMSLTSSRSTSGSAIARDMRREKCVFVQSTGKCFSSASCVREFENVLCLYVCVYTYACVYMLQTHVAGPSTNIRIGDRFQ